MMIRLIGVSLLCILALAACKPESRLQSPLASPLLSPVEPLSTKTPTPFPTQPSIPQSATATPLLLPTTASLPTAVPPVSLASPNNQPVLSQDLLYLRDGRLIRWNHRTGQQEVLAGPDLNSKSLSVQPVLNGVGGPPLQAGYVLAFSTSTDGQKIVLHRFAASPAGYDLEILDLNTHQLTVLYSGISQGFGLLAMSISPDGRFVAWIPQDLIPAAGQGRTSGLAAPARGSGLKTGPILVAPLDKLDQKREIGHCGGQQTRDFDWGCNGLLWSPDSQSVAWADGDGVWLADLKGASRQLIRTALTMPGRDQVQGLYTLREWSPSGRYVLLSIGHYEGSSLGILDTKTGQTAPLPNSFEYAYPGPVATWTRDDQLFVGRPGRVDIDVRPALEMWHIDASSGLTLTVAHSLDLDVNPDNAPVGLIQKRDGQLALALVNHSNTDYIDRGLYLVDPHTLAMEKVNGLPPLGRENINAGGSLYNVDVFWTRDGSGALVFDRDSRPVLYAPTTVLILYDVRPLLGDTAYGFHWVNGSDG